MPSRYEDDYGPRRGYPDSERRSRPDRRSEERDDYHARYSDDRRRDRSPTPPSRSRSDRRDRSRSRDRQAASARRPRERSVDSGSSSSAEGPSKPRKRRSRSPSRDRDESRAERKARKRARRERKEAKKAAKKAKLGAIDSYGAHGILSEADIYTKDAEFRTWLVEEKMINPETISQAKNKELFRTFMEDFNTSSLPHDKYYNLEAYEKRMNSVRMGEQDDAAVKGYDFRADEEDMRNARKRAAPKIEDSILTREQLLDLQRIERERVEGSRMKRLGMDVKSTLGVRYGD